MVATFLSSRQLMDSWLESRIVIKTPQDQQKAADSFKIKKKNETEKTDFPI